MTIAQPGKRLLAREDPDMVEEVVKILREDGVEVLLEAETRHVAPATGGKIDLAVQAAGDRAPRTLMASHLLIATGRVPPNTESLNLAAAGVQTDKRGFIQVNERLETSVPRIYAMGDVKGGPAFTHISYDDFRILEANLLKGGHASTKGRLVPYTVFMDSQLGRVGLTEQKARSQGRSIRVAKMPMGWLPRRLKWTSPAGS